MTLLHASGAGFEIGDRTLLAGLDLAVGAGELVAIVGPNGAGKTTALGLLAGDLHPSAGSVSITGRPVGAMPLAERALLRAVLPARTEPDVPFTVREVVELGRRPHGDAGTGGTVAVEKAMQRTDVDTLAGRAFRELSTGEQARVTLARVLAQAAPVVLLDEPTSSLDIRHGALVMATLRVTGDEGAAVVAVLHDLNLAAAHADRVVVLAEGRVAADGAPGDVLSSRLLSDVYGHPVRVIPHPLHSDSVLIVS